MSQGETDHGRAVSGFSPRSYFNISSNSVSSVISGTFVSSLSLPGFSITLVLLPREPVAPTAFVSKLAFDKELVLYTLDAPTEAPGWRWHHKGRPEAHIEEKTEKVQGLPAVEEIKGPARRPSDLQIGRASCRERVS